MNKLFMMFFDVCRLRAAPQDLPTSRSLLIYSLAVYAVLALMLSWIQMTPGKALIAAAKAAGETGYAAQWAGQGAPLSRTLPAAELVALLGAELQCSD